jgi:hypothetical protein
VSGTASFLALAQEQQRTYPIWVRFSLLFLGVAKNRKQKIKFHYLLWI